VFRLRPLYDFAPSYFAVAVLATQALIRVAKPSYTTRTLNAIFQDIEKIIDKIK